MEKFEFKVGDKVIFGGIEGIVTDDDSFEIEDYPIRAIFDNGHSPAEYFTKDGRLYSYHKEPTLKLVERPKRKVKKTITVYANLYENAVCNGTGLGPTYTNREEALDKSCISNLIAAGVKLTGEYEVEE